VHQDAAKFLRVLLVCLVGDKAGRVPSCPTWLTHGATSERVLLEGLRRYAKHVRRRAILTASLHS
ncbi:unnamed protein product, partial [Pylaiella littoralis]